MAKKNAYHSFERSQSMPPGRLHLAGVAPESTASQGFELCTLPK